MPRIPSSPIPPFIPPGLSGPFQWHSLSTTPSFWFPVHRLHWSHHSLSPPVPLPSVIRPPDQCKLRTPYPLHILHFPCPQLTPLHPPPPPPPPPPPLYLTQKFPPPIGGLVREGHSPVIPLTDLRPSRTNPSICIYQPLNQTHSVHLPQRQTWGHMVSSFKFSDHIISLNDQCHQEHARHPSKMWTKCCNEI